MVHVPKLLYYWRSHAGSVASDINAKSYAIEAARGAVAHIFALRIHEQLFDPVQRDHLRVVVEQQDILALRLRCPQVIDP